MQARPQQARGPLLAPGQCLLSAGVAGVDGVQKGRVESVVELPHGRTAFDSALGHGDASVCVWFLGGRRGPMSRKFQRSGDRGAFTRLTLERHRQVLDGRYFDHAIPEGQETFRFVGVRAWA